LRNESVPFAVKAAKSCLVVCIHCQHSPSTSGKWNFPKRGTWIVVSKIVLPSKQQQFQGSWSIPCRELTLEERNVAAPLLLMRKLHWPLP
jgi:hypothetical protein